MSTRYDSRQYALALSAGNCQRWRDGRARYRPVGELFDPRYFAVELIDDSIAKGFTVAHHYSRTWPATRLRVGLLEKRPFHNERLCGVAAFSHPMSQAVIPKWLGVENSLHGIELGRFVLLDEIKAMGETWTLARAFRLLRATLPEVRAALAFCDPSERRTLDGAIVKRGHQGTIYKAFNGRYVGRSDPRTLLITPVSTVASERALAKLRSGDSGAAYALRQLRDAGCTRLSSSETGASYIKRLIAAGELRRERHHGNFVFAWHWG